MGIKDLNKLIESRSKRSRTTHEISEIKGKIVAVDANNIIWIIASGVNKTLVSSMKDIINDEYNHSAFFSMIISRMLSLEHQIRSNGGMTIWCFDGDSVEDKEEEVKKRRESREKITEKIKTLKSMIKGDAESIGEDEKIKDEIKKNMNNSIPMSYEIIANIMEKFMKFGINTVRVYNEAEAYAASLVINGFADCVYTTDTDVLAIGCTYMITSFQNNGFTLVNLDTILEDLGLTQGEFRDLCILLGCDFNKKLKGKGPDKTANLISQYRKIEYIPGANLEELRFERCRQLLSPSQVEFERDIERTVCIDSLKDYVHLSKIGVLSDFESFERQSFKRNYESYVNIIRSL